VAQFDAQAEIQKSQAKAELQRLTAAEVVRQQIEKQKITIAAEAEAEKTRREAQGHADATLLKYEAEAKGIRQVLEAKAQGYQALVQSAGNDARAAATLLLTEKLEQIVTLQVEAIKAIKIDKVTVWDSGGANGNGSTTANFLAGMVKSLPPLHDVAAMAGLDLPKYLGDATAQLPTPNGQEK
jgi:flotillin